MDGTEADQDAATGSIAKAVLDGIDALLAAIDSDENRSGGLLQRDTHRRAGELRLAVASERCNAGMAAPADPERASGPLEPL